MGTNRDGAFTVSGVGNFQLHGNHFKDLTGKVENRGQIGLLAIDRSIDLSVRHIDLSVTELAQIGGDIDVLGDDKRSVRGDQHFLLIIACQTMGAVSIRNAIHGNGKNRVHIGGGFGSRNVQISLRGDFRGELDLEVRRPWKESTLKIGGERINLERCDLKLEASDRPDAFFLEIAKVPEPSRPRPATVH